MKKLKNLYQFIRSNGLDDFKPVVDIDINYLYLKDNKGTRIFYDNESDSFKVKCRIKCIKDDNSITFLDDPIIMDLYAKEKTDVLSILKSKF
jgi:glutamine amidotransferase PdxT